MSSNSNSVLPPIRRIITGHTSSGKAIYLSDEEFRDTTTVNPGDIHISRPPPPVPEDKAPRFTHLFVAPHNPLPSNEAGSDFTDIVKKDPSQGELLVPPNGSVARIIDVPPNSGLPNHRTLSLDYVIVVRGSIGCELDEGESKIFKAGDVIVQRGTIHRWFNQSNTEWARLFFVMLTSNPIKVSGSQELVPEFLP